MKSIIPAILALLCAVSAAKADPCKLTLSTTLVMEAHDGHADVPVSINGETLKLMVDTGGAVTALGSDAADRLGLPRHPQNHSSEVIFGGAPITQYVTADRFSLGNINGYHVNFAVLPKGVMQGEDGMIGTGILAAYDIDFDFANSKFSMFSQQHCYGGVVYWTRANFVQVPVRFDESHHIELDASVDGKPTLAVLDTGAPQTIISLEYAENSLGVDPQSPDLKALPASETGGAHVYRYPFKTLSLNGLIVNNPDIFLVPNGESDTLGDGRGRPSLLLGLSVLSKLHLYVAYGEHNLYITPADAH